MMSFLKCNCSTQRELRPVKVITYIQIIQDKPAVYELKINNTERLENDMVRGGGLIKILLTSYMYPFISHILNEVLCNYLESVQNQLRGCRSRRLIKVFIICIHRWMG